MRPLAALFCSLLLIFSHATLAQADFYASVVEVEDRSTEALRQGLREALVRVLSKASGVPSELIKQRSGLAQDLMYGDKLASQFAYHSKKVCEGDDCQQQLYLKVSFPEGKVVSLLQKGGLTFWAPVRPALSLLVLEKQGGQTLWFEDEQGVLKELQKNAILNWGFAVTPEQLTVEPSNLWYAEDALLAQNEAPLLLLRLRQSDAEQVSGSAGLTNLEQTQFIQADTLEQWFQTAIDWAAAQLSAEYAVQLQTTDSEIVLRFTGVSDYQHYQTILAAVETLDIVQHVYVLGLDKQALRLAVSYTTRPEQLQQQLLQNKKMQLSKENSASNYQLELQWVE